MFRARKSGIIILLPILAGFGLVWWWLTQRTGAILDVVLSLVTIILALPFALATLRMLTLRASLDAGGLTHGRARVDWDDIQAIQIIQPVQPSGPRGRPRPGRMDVLYLRGGRMGRLRLSWFVQGATGALPDRFLARLNEHRAGQGQDKAAVQVVRA